MLSDFNIPAPRDWQKLERLCHELYAADWNDPNAQLNGRSGQEQAGVDIYGRPNKGPDYAGVQCKQRDGVPDTKPLSAKALRKEVEKAKTFKPPLKHFTIVTTGPRDVKALECVREINAEHQRSGLFEVAVHFWDDVVRLLHKHPGVYVEHYAEFVLTAQQFARALAAKHGGADITSPTSIAGLARNEILQSEFGAQLDAVKALLANDHATIALQEAQALSARIWDRSDTPTRIRLHGLIGVIEMELGQNELAATALLKGLSEDPTNSKALAYAALACSLRGDSTGAAEWAKRAIEKDSSNVLAAQMMILSDTRSEAEVYAQAAKALGPRADIMSALAQRAISRDDLVRGLYWAEAALKLEPDSKPFRATIAEIKVLLIARSEGSSGNLSDVEQRNLRDCGDLLYEMWEQLEPALRASRSGWLRSAALAAHLLNDHSALERSDRLLQIEPNDREFVRLRVGVLAANGEFDSARLLLEASEPLGPADTALLALTHAKLGNIAEAAESWRSLLDRDDVPTELRIDTERNYVIALLEQGKSEEAKTFTAQRLAQQPNDAAALLNATRVAESQADTSRLQELLKHAESIATNDNAPLWMLRTADLLARHERFDAAIALYESVLDRSCDSAYVRRYVETLVAAERFHSARDVAVNLASSSSFYLEVQCDIHERLGNVSEVISLCEQHLANHPNDGQVRLRLAIQYLRQGDQDRARDTAALVSTDWQPEHLNRALVHAWLLSTIGDPAAALDVLYKARNRNPDSAQAHLTYLTRYTELRDDVAPTLVTMGTAVNLDGAGAPGWVLFTSSRNESLEGRAYDREHALAKAILGKRVGDQVLFEGSANVWTIRDIATKYAFAFIESGKLFPARFPTTGGFWHVPIAGDNAEDLLEQTKRLIAPRHSRQEAVKAMYAEGRGTVGTIAILLRCPINEALGTALATPSGLQAFSNTRDEDVQASNLLAGERPSLAIDLTSVFILDALNLLRDPVGKHCELIVAQSSIDALQEQAVTWRNQRVEGVMRVGIEHGELVKHTASAEYVRNAAAHFSGLLDWLRKNCLVRGVSPEIAESYRIKPDPRPLVGDTFWDTALIAKESGLLLSDDLRFRSLVRASLGAKSVCTATLLSALARSKKVTPLAYDEAIATLHHMGYQSLPISAGSLLAAARLDEWAAGEHFQSLLRTLEGPNTETGSVVRVAVHFIKELWLLPTFEQTRLALVFALLDAIIVGRNALRVIEQTQLGVTQSLRLLPLHAPEVLELIIRWKEQRSPRL